MAGEYGQIAIQGFQTGLNISRNLEETTQLIRKREEKEQASQLIKDAMSEMQAHAEKQAIPAAEYAQLDRAERAGQPIDKGRKAVLQQELIDLATDAVKLQAAMSNKLMASGNMLAMDKGQELLKQSVDNMAALGGLHLKGQELQDRREEGAADRGLKRELAGQAEAGETERLGMKIESEEGMNYQNRASAERQTAMQTGTQRDIANMEDVTRNRGITAGLHQDDRDFNERKREWDLMNDTPAKKINNLLEIGSGINAMKAQGMTDEQIDKQLPGGVTVAQFENTFSHYSEDTAVKLKALEARHKSLMNRKEHGENVDVMLNQVNKKMATLRRIDDAVADRQLEWENYNDDHNAVERAGARFGEYVGKVGDFVGGVVTSPIYFPAGAIGGPSHRQGGPERDAAKQVKSAPPKGRPDY